ncbi:helix-turn-helix domain-containing protein [Streptomyces bobili]|uniref:AlbA family DNA-binding domain-containing protein n=1 Tax=Streptomyces bobili TaxID=67280 RepID=UPI0036660A57
MEGIRMNVEEVRRLLKQGESDTVEFKTSAPRSSHELAKQLASLANTRGGVVVYGVAPTGQPVGMSIADMGHLRTRVQKVAESLIRPADDQYSIRFQTILLDGERLLLVFVPDLPEYVKPVRLADGSTYERRPDGGTFQTSEGISSSHSENSSTSASMFTIFVSMSFREDEEPALVDYFEAMKRAASLLPGPHRIYRVDQAHGDFEIVPEIEKNIKESDLVIVDFTMNRPNVYYEAGIARGLDKYSVRTARKGTELPFDVATRKCYFYANATQLELILRDPLLEAYEKLRDWRP